MLGFGGSDARSKRLHRVQLEAQMEKGGGALVRGQLIALLRRNGSDVWRSDALLRRAVAEPAND